MLGNTPTGLCRCHGGVLGREETSMVGFLNNGPAQWFHYLRKPDDCPICISHVIVMFPCSGFPSPTACPVYTLYHEPFNHNKLTQIGARYVPSYLRPVALLQFFKCLSLFWSGILKETPCDHSIPRGVPPSSHCCSCLLS